MNDELLKQFYIGKCSENLFINATDEAYKLLGLKEKLKSLKSCMNIDTIDRYYYIYAFVTFLAKNYKINGLIRESRGNSHDADWQEEVTIIDNGGAWKQELDEYRNKKASLYVSKPIIITQEVLSKDLLEKWAKEYNLSCNGEESRSIYCSYSDGSGRTIYEFEKSSIYGRANDRMFMCKDNNYAVSPVCLVRKR